MSTLISNGVCGVSQLFSGALGCLNFLDVLTPELATPASVEYKKTWTDSNELC